MLCISQLDYAHVILYNVPKKLNKYQNIQNICAKIALNKSKYFSTTEALKTLHWLPIWQQIQYNIVTVTVLLMFKCINNRTPGYMQEPITTMQSERENMRSNNKGTILKIPKVKREMFTARVFLYLASTLWNGLPKHIRNLTLLDQFKGKLKTHLYSKAFLT